MFTDHPLRAEFLVFLFLLVAELFPSGLFIESFFFESGEIGLAK